ncbi:hypothetical protein BDV98DRAFT_561289 [Pterulicium gracile]|uniref:Uncharacterized protein n=1 Tax=Pterulicium gracile TaxID=1884261 RepID=A0A5C3R2N0_9AGAR|nr:hypothetical protein BDV98DRAFT_561289 [Pterula gracilis]
MQLKLVFTTFVFTLLSFAAAQPATPTVKDTNASRLARGLPLLRPRSITHKSLGRKRSHPSPSPSPLPLLNNNLKVAAAQPPATWRTGRIQVRNTDGLALGYVRNAPGAEPVNGINFGVDSQDVRVGFTTKPGSVLLDLAVTNPNFNGPTYLGARSSSSHNTHLAAGSADAIDFMNVNITPAHGGPLPIPGTSDKGESAIWTLDEATKQFIPHYINPDGIQVATQIAYISQDNKIFFTGSVEAWNVANGGAAVVTFHLEESF